MCLTLRKRKTKSGKKYKKKIYPEPSYKDLKTEDFIKECICCQNCKQIFNLGSNEIKIHCAGCDKFYHCGIAGQCVGDKCNLPTMLGSKHRLSWCIHCVPDIKKNKEKKDGLGECICYECI
ncbi:MAG: hypothetical protein CMK44_01495 [Porticoccus sp.]|nr:hypothetical protein [Porticoccus sp.]